MRFVAPLPVHEYPVDVGRWDLRNTTRMEMASDPLKNKFRLQRRKKEEIIEIPVSYFNK
jgi:hypothetical protein